MKQNFYFEFGRNNLMWWTLVKKSHKNGDYCQNRNFGKIRNWLKLKF